MQRSTSPTQMSPDSSVHYTRTGRISKAKKGLKVHHCDCGRVRTVFSCSVAARLSLFNTTWLRRVPTQPYRMQRLSRGAAIHLFPIDFTTFV